MERVVGVVGEGLDDTLGFDENPHQNRDSYVAGAVP